MAVENKQIYKAAHSSKDDRKGGKARPKQDATVAEAMAMFT
jgi:hypothetical protein